MLAAELVVHVQVSVDRSRAAGADGQLLLRKASFQGSCEIPPVRVAFYVSQAVN